MLYFWYFFNLFIKVLFIQGHRLSYDRRLHFLLFLLVLLFNFIVFRIDLSLWRWGNFFFQSFWYDFLNCICSFCWRFRQGNSLRQCCWLFLFDLAGLLFGWRWRSFRFRILLSWRSFWWWRRRWSIEGSLLFYFFLDLRRYWRILINFLWFRFLGRQNNIFLNFFRSKSISNNFFFIQNISYFLFRDNFRCFLFTFNRIR